MTLRPELPLGRVAARRRRHYCQPSFMFSIRASGSDVSAGRPTVRLARCQARADSSAGGVGEVDAAVAVGERREQGQGAFAWVALDSSDSDPIRFWGLLARGAADGGSRTRLRSVALLRAPGVDLVGEMLGVLLGELEAFGRPLVLALDDYHLLEGEAVHAGMRRLLDYLPDRVCVAIATRPGRRFRFPPRARGQLVEVDADELRFSRTEAGVLRYG
jgi:ATP/maltotriose-dependent transcriptional regulator MalT